ncbi:transglutaminase-like cysteine peptidase [Rhodopseudomonas sp. NSM]|uniref:transglutaminase-like cysteine peptidase n=1 Tax=Rhodopseudomonas sp. NSM TaxID=3457630 RepID=UPI00403718D1
MSTNNNKQHRQTISISRLWRMLVLPLMAVVVATVPAKAFLARPVIFASIGSVTTAPSGWLQFCSENPDECRTTPDPQQNVELTPDLLQQLFTINAFANDRVKWTSDLERYGKIERWAMPLDRGDCEDIVLLKRRMLAQAGWPTGALLITTVEDPKAGNGRHAVLTVRTDRGEFILDNQSPEILFWYETQYRFLSRQSATDPNLWVAFADAKELPGPVLAPRVR